MFGSLKDATAMAKKLMTMKDEIETMQDIQPLLEAINSAQADATEALSKIHNLTEERITLERELSALKATDDKRSQYEIVEFPTRQVALKRKEGNDKAYPYICAPCSESDVISPLQANGIMLHCTKCQTSVLTKPRPSRVSVQSVTY